MGQNSRAIEFAATGTVDELISAMGSLNADVFRERLERADDCRIGLKAKDRTDENLDVT